MGDNQGFIELGPPRVCEVVLVKGKKENGIWALSSPWDTPWNNSSRRPLFHCGDKDEDGDDYDDKDDDEDEDDNEEEEDYKENKDRDNEEEDEENEDEEYA